MSRMRRLVHAVASGYVAIGANVIYALVSVPLALRYLSSREFGLWAVVSQLAAYLAYIDFGIWGASYRFLIDHKDDKTSGKYGETLITSAVVFAGQGLLIMLLAWALSGVLPQWLAIEATQVHDFQRLLMWQCAILAIGIVLRFLSVPLQSHQRFDVINWVQAGGQLIMVGLLWLFFAQGLGLDAMLWAAGLGMILRTAVSSFCSWRLGLLPPKGCWGRPRWSTLREIAGFGRDLFLLAIGWQLVSGTPILIITRMLGVESAAIWAVCSKAFTLVQQFVWGIFDYSGPALAEMHVRGETERLRDRFRHIVMLTSALAAATAAIAAAGNGSFVAVWTHGRMAWPFGSDIAFACWLFTSSVTRCFNLWVGAIKEIGGVRFVYVVQGGLFVLLATPATAAWGLEGLIWAAALADLLCAGSYGFVRSKSFFVFTWRELGAQWLAPSVKVFASSIALAVASWWLFTNLSRPAQFVLSIAATGLGAGPAFWLVGLDPALRDELRRRFRSKAQT